MKFAYVFALIVIAPSAAVGDEFCNWRPRQIDNPADIRATTLVLTTPRDTLGIYENCVTIIRGQFGSVLSFALVNRFPKEIGMTSAYALVKSTRVLSSKPLVKISLSRGNGWFLPGGARSQTPLPEMFFEPFKGTVEEWNAAHASFATPEDLAKRLKSAWHAYTTPDFGVSSTDVFQFWPIDSSFDQIHGVSTHYLLRFDVNTEQRVSFIPFTVYLQPEVQQIGLQIYSNIESLSGEYKFIVR